MITDVKSILAKTSLLSEAPESMIDEIAKAATYLNLKQGEYLCHEGDLSDALYVLVRGTADIIKDNKGVDHLINQVGSGETLGEMGMMDELPRSASIRISSETAYVVVVSRQVVIASLEKDPVIFRETLRVLSKRLRDSNMQLEKRLIEIEQKNEELEESYTATVIALSQALEFRDKVTGGHSERVTAYSLVMADSMGFSDEEMEHLRLGALLHDIGKIGVSDLILNKEGKLTDEEFATMQEHPTFGMKMIGKIEFLKEAADIVYCHHEKWNGRGYPQKLEGENIPLTARIFAIADVFDALTMERPYKAAWSPEEARDEIVNCGGSHFDPSVVKHFVKEFPRICKILERSKSGERISVLKGLPF